MNSCQNCNAYQRDKNIEVKLGHPQRGWCRAATPNLIQVGTPQPNGQIQINFDGIFVPVWNTMWCRQWQAAAAREPDDAANKPAA
jgi:hypothetical protein